LALVVLALEIVRVITEITLFLMQLLLEHLLAVLLQRAGAVPVSRPTAQLLDKAVVLVEVLVDLAQIPEVLVFLAKVTLVGRQ
jgi:hypothetical protein